MKFALLIVTVLFCMWHCLDYTSQKAASWQFRFIFVFAGASVTLLAFVLSATLLAILGLYSLFACCALLCTGVALHRVYLKVRLGMPLFSTALFTSMRASFKLPKLLPLVAACIVAVSGMLYAAYPTNYLFGGRDFGLYLINAVHISNTGAYQYETDEFYAERYEDVKDFAMLAYPALFNAEAQGITNDVGKLDPQFLPMTSAYHAIFYDIGGFSGVLRANAVVAVMCLLTVYYFCKFCFNQKTATLAVILLAVCPAQIWNARITCSEIIAQLLFLLTAYCMAIGWRKHSESWIIAAGFLLSIGFFNRIDHYLLLIALFALTCYAILWQPAYTKAMLKASGVATVLAVVSIWYGFTFHHYYFYEHFASKGLKPLLAGCLLALLVTIGIFIVRTPLRKLKIANPISALQAPKAAGVAALLLFALFLFAYFVSPLLADSFAANSMREYSWYLSALAVPLCIYSIYTLFADAKSTTHINPLLWFLLCGLANVIMYTVNPSISTDHFWASRRWLPVNNPFILIFAAYGLVQLYTFAQKQRHAIAKHLQRTASIACACIMVAYMGWQCRLFITTPMFSGINGQYAALSAALPQNAMVLTTNGNIASVLKYVYNRNVYLCNYSQADIDASLANNNTPLSTTPFSLQAATDYIEKYGELYVIGNVGTFWQAGQIEPVYTGVLTGSFPEAVSSAYPQALERWEYDVSVYRITPATGSLSSYDFLHDLYTGPAGEKTENRAITSNAAGLVSYGPYAAAAPGNYRLLVSLTADAASEAQLAITLQNGQVTVSETLLQGGGQYSIEFTLQQQTTALEFVLYNLNGMPLTCTSMVLQALPA